MNKMRLHRIQVPVVYQCAILHAYLKKNGTESELVQGFVTIMGQGACRHYWVELQDGTQLDIATELGARFAPDISKYVMKLERYTDANRFDTDEKSALIVQENECLFELFTKDPKQFWKGKPKALEKLKF